LNGTNPDGGLLADKKGVLYGTASGEVRDCGNPGSVYEMVPTPSGGYTKQTIYYFCGLGPSCSLYGDGDGPQGELIAGKSGAFYGTTAFGGAYGVGTVYKLSAKPKIGWTDTVLHSFHGRAYGDGAYPQSGLVADSSGALYGTTFNGGSQGDVGILFKLTPTGSGWSYTILHVFGSISQDGFDPDGRLLYIESRFAIAGRVYEDGARR
jgi:uncharacterized repeat protein (TIGR03803 family)